MPLLFKKAAAICHGAACHTKSITNSDMEKEGDDRRQMAVLRDISEEDNTPAGDRLKLELADSKLWTAHVVENVRFRESAVNLM